MSCLPTELPGHEEVAWIPVDTLSRILYEIVSADIEALNTSPPTKIFHLADPAASKWTSLVLAIVKLFQSSSVHENASVVETVPFAAWFAKLEESSKAGTDVDINPGIKLLQFFQSMRDGVDEIKLDTTESKQMSATLRNLKPVGEEWMSIWLNQWAKATK